MLDIQSADTLRLVASDSAQWLDYAELSLTFCWLVGTLVLIYLTQKSLSIARTANETTERNTGDANRISREAVETARVANAFQRGVADRQFRLTTYPITHIEIERIQTDDSTSFQVDVYNIGSSPAADAQVFMFGHFFDMYSVGDPESDDFDIEEEERTDLVGHWKLPVLSPHYRYSFRQSADAEYIGIELLLQFRDALGANHIERYSFSTTRGDSDSAPCEMKEKEFDLFGEHPRLTVYGPSSIDEKLLSLHPVDELPHLVTLGMESAVGSFTAFQFHVMQLTCSEVTVHRASSPKN